MPRPPVLLRSAGVAVLLDVEGPDLPRILHWGADPGALPAEADVILCSAVGMDGPGARDEMYAAMAAICSSSYCTGPRAAWAPGLASGIRPVDTWKCTPADPTPMSVGPFAVPWACMPWQEEHPSRYSCLP